MPVQFFKNSCLHTVKSIKYFIIFFMSFSVFNAWSNTPLDGSGGTAITDSNYYRDKINQLGREIDASTLR